MLLFLCGKKNCGGKTLLFRRNGEFSFLFWSPVFDLLLGATVNKVAMAMAGAKKKQKTKHIMWLKSTLLCNKIQQQVHVLPERDRRVSLGSVWIVRLYSADAQCRATQHCLTKKSLTSVSCGVRLTFPLQNVLSSHYSACFYVSLSRMCVPRFRLSVFRTRLRLFLQLIILDH